MISDSYDLKLVDDFVYEADCAMITEGAVEVGTFNAETRNLSSSCLLPLLSFEADHVCPTTKISMPTRPPRRPRRLLTTPPSASTTSSILSACSPQASTRSSILPI